MGTGSLFLRRHQRQLTRTTTSLAHSSMMRSTIKSLLFQLACALLGGVGCGDPAATCTTAGECSPRDGGSGGGSSRDGGIGGSILRDGGSSNNNNNGSAPRDGGTAAGGSDVSPAVYRRDLEARQRRSGWPSRRPLRLSEAHQAVGPAQRTGASARRAHRVGEVVQFDVPSGTGTISVVSQASAGVVDSITCGTSTIDNTVVPTKLTTRRARRSTMIYGRSA